MRNIPDRCHLQIADREHDVTAKARRDPNDPAPELNGMGGVYCENCDIAALEIVDPITGWKRGDSMLHNGVMPYAVDPEAADRLWNLSEQRLGLNPRA